MWTVCQRLCHYTTGQTIMKEHSAIVNVKQPEYSEKMCLDACTHMTTHTHTTSFISKSKTLSMRLINPKSQYKWLGVSIALINLSTQLQQVTCCNTNQQFVLPDWSYQLLVNSNKAVHEYRLILQTGLGQKQRMNPHSLVCDILR